MGAGSGRRLCALAASVGLLAAVGARAQRVSAEVAVGRPRFVCARPTASAVAERVAAQVWVDAEGRLVRFSVEAPNPPLGDVVRQCLRTHFQRWEPARRGAAAVDHGWLVTFTFPAGATDAVVTPSGPLGDDAPAPALPPDPYGALARGEAAVPPPDPLPRGRHATVSPRESVATTIASADACIQDCDDPPRDYELEVHLEVGDEGRLTRVRLQGGPSEVQVCVARCLHGLEYSARGAELELPLTMRARSRPASVPSPPGAAGILRGRPLFGCPVTRHTVYATLRGESRIRVTVSPEGRLVDFRVRGGTSPLRAFVRRCLEINRGRWAPARDARTGEPVQASWDTRYRFESQVWEH